MGCIVCNAWRADAPPAISAECVSKAIDVTVDRQDISPVISVRVVCDKQDVSHTLVVNPNYLWLSGDNHYRGVFHVRSNTNWQIK